MIIHDFCFLWLCPLEEQRKFAVCLIDLTLVWVWHTEDTGGGDRDCCLPVDREHCVPERHAAQALCTPELKCSPLGLIPKATCSYPCYFCLSPGVQPCTKFQPQPFKNSLFWDSISQTGLNLMILLSGPQKTKIKIKTLHPPCRSNSQNIQSAWHL